MRVLDVLPVFHLGRGGMRHEELPGPLRQEEEDGSGHRAQEVYQAVSWDAKRKTLAEGVDLIGVPVCL